MIIFWPAVCYQIRNFCKHNSHNVFVSYGKGTNGQKVGKVKELCSYMFWDGVEICNTFGAVIGGWLT
jgi:hypothetical protein